MNRLKWTKQFFILILMGLLFFSCQKKDVELEKSNIEQKTDVSLELAKKVALNYAHDFFDEANLKSKKINFRDASYKSDRIIQKVLTIENETKKPLMYVIQLESQGFIIVSGTKKSTPILAFSKTGKFDVNEVENLPIGVSDWIEGQKKRLKNLKELEANFISDDITSQWKILECMAPPHDDEIIISGGTVHEEVGPLTSTTWSQGVGYNNNAPYYGCSNTDNGRAWAGCVAVATAQIMKYWEHPNSYNWSLMPDDAGSSETSRLIRDIGDEVIMIYGCSGSGAAMENVVDALVYEFNYSSSASYVHVWGSTIVTQLNYGWPIIMSGSGSAGHAWVCDGYKRNRHIHIHNPGTYYEYETSTISNYYLQMSWGQNDGLYNAWYLYNDYTPGSSNFNSNNRMIINIHP